MITIAPKLKTSKENDLFRWTFLGSNCVWGQFDHYGYITLLLNSFFVLLGGGVTIILTLFSVGRKYNTSEGSSSGNCQETETCMVLACHTPRQPLPHHPSGHQRVSIPAHARTSHRASCRKQLEEDLCWIICHNYLPDKPIGQGTELNWYIKPIT